jgi:hypothetical protein
MGWRILRAFGWMRWRVLLNSLERTGARDTLERLSLAIDQLGPIIAALLLVPSLLAMSALSGFAGYSLARTPQDSLPFEILRYLTLAVVGFAVIGPIVLPVMERPNTIRLLLLPIPRAILYVSQASTALADPWTLVFLPVIVFLPLGLAAGGAVQGAGLALLAGLLFLVVLVGLSTFTSCAVQLVVRDRRRGELAALALVLLIPLTAMLTNLVGRNVSRPNRPAPGTPRERSPAIAVADRAARRAFVAMPSERYVRATRAGAERRPAESVGPLLALAATATLLHGLAVLAFHRLLAFPGAVVRRRSGGRRTARPLRLPGMPLAASAVAIAQLRLALRTPRGRSTLLSPLLVFMVLTALGLSRGTVPFSISAHSGIGLAALGATFSILATLPFAMNQFAIDGAGLTLQLLSPVSDDDLLNGKAVANGLLAGAPALLCIVAALCLFPGGPAGLWISVPFAVASIYLLVAPAAAALSSVFPRAVDLNSIGSGSNAHGIAGLLGIGSVLIAAVPPAGLALLADAWLEQPELTPVVLLAWCAATFGINRLLARPLRALLASRRENLALVAG